MKEVRYGIVGAGNQGTYYALRLNGGEVASSRLTAVADINPAKIDAPLLDLALLISREAEALKELMPLLKDVKGNFQKLMLHCDQVKELEHAADDEEKDRSEPERDHRA